MLPPHIHEVHAGMALGLVSADGVVGWAGNVLSQDCDTKSLRILAGLEPPLDHNEVQQLFALVFKEQGIQTRPSDQHVALYTTSLLEEMRQGKLARKETLRRLADLHLARHYDDQLRDFYLLYHAKWDLESEPVQWYWANADRSNIDRVIDEYAASWLGRHPSESSP
ncbi:MAG: hypothetical protein IPL39_08435 [Opitutaceae bacterium]|nr:hypothetical protein [Opitutaceae bacterium]